MSYGARAAILIAVLSAHASALGLLGRYGSPWEARTAMAVTVLGALAAGIVEGSSWRIQLRAAAAWCAFSVTFLVAIIVYLHFRHAYHPVEMLLPLVAGAIPFLVVREALRLAVLRGGDPAAHEPDFAAVLAMTIIVLTVGSSWALFRPVLENAGDTATPDTTYAWIIEMTSDGSLSYDGGPLSESDFPGLCRRVMSLHPDNPHELRVHCPHGGAGLATRTLDPLLKECGPKLPQLLFDEAE